MTSGGPLVDHPRPEPGPPPTSAARRRSSPSRPTPARPRTRSRSGRTSSSRDDTPYEFVQFAAIDLVAFETHTQVFINSPGAGTVSFTLQAGQHYTNCNGYRRHHRSPAPGRDRRHGRRGGVLTINAGTKISSTKPVAILLFTAAPRELRHGLHAGSARPAARQRLHPARRRATTPRVNGDRPFNVYAYNPDPANALIVSTTDTNAGTATLSLAANETTDYSARTCTGACPTTYVPVELVGPPHRRPATSGGSPCTTTRGPRTTGATPGWPRASSRAATRSPTRPGVSDPVAAAAARAATLRRTQRRRLPPAPARPPAPEPATASTAPPSSSPPPRTGPTSRSTSTTTASTTSSTRNSDDCPDNGQATDSTCGTRPLTASASRTASTCVDALAGRSASTTTPTTTTPAPGWWPSASKPIAMSYGQDTDQATGSDDIQDTGYTVYPLTQRFLDPVLVVGKDGLPDRGLRGDRRPGHLHAPPSSRTRSRRSRASPSTDLLPAGLPADYVRRQHARHVPEPRPGHRPTRRSSTRSPGRDSCPEHVVPHLDPAPGHPRRRPDADRRASA